MGRGNACVHNDYEGLYYVDYDNFRYDYEDGESDNIIDYEIDDMLVEDSLYMFKEDFKKRFKSFIACDKWLGRGDHIILENELFYITVEDNEWSLAIKLLQKETPYYWNGDIENLQVKHYKTYLKGIEESLFNQFEELGVYAGPWTSGRIKRSMKGEKHES